MLNKSLKIVACVSLGILCLYGSACKQDKKSVKTVVITFKKEGELILRKSNDSIVKTIDIEIADDEYQTQTGLMYRESMLDNQGMLFVFDEESYHSFYMKNTKIALDIIYIGADKKIVSFQKNAQPMDETSLPSDAPAKYVLEINAGLSDRWDLEIGDIIEYTSN